MKDRKLTKSILAVVAIAALVAGCTKADDPEPKTRADVAEAAYPVDKIEFQKNGYMSQADEQLLIDNTKRSAALSVYIWSLPRVLMETSRLGNREMGVDTLTMPVTEDGLKPSTVVATGNQSTIYMVVWVDFDGEPLVIEYPDNALGYIDDGWQRSLYDGVPDGKPSKPIFILPVNYEGEIPSQDDYTILRPKTAGGLFLARGLGPKEQAVADIKKSRIYYYKNRNNIPEQKFVNWSEEPYRNMNVFNFPRGLKYWEVLNDVVQKDLINDEDRVMYGFMQFLGIEKGKPFNPSPQMKELLTTMEDVGYKTTHALGFSGLYAPKYYDNGTDWTRIFLTPVDPENARKGSREVFDYKNFMGVVQRAHFAQDAMSTSPLAALKFVGKGSQYLYSARDSDHNTLDGAETYRLHVPANVPAKNFWSITLYDPISRSMLQGTGSDNVTIDSNHTLKQNADGSYDLFVGPNESKIPAEYRGTPNFAATNPDKGLFVYFRFFGPLEPFFDKTWQLESFEKIK
jgi:hypothetical protein